MMSEWLYRRLLWLYPADFRRDYGALMVQIFNDMRADGGGLRFWMRILRDLAVSAITERFYQDGGLTMKPQQIDRFEIRADLGEGALSDVYLAYDPEHEQQVALKVLNFERASQYDPDPQVWVHNLQREAEMMARLDHPAVPKSFGMVQTDGHTALAMEYVPGDDLLALMEAHGEPLPEAELIEWALKVCEVLTYVHEQGLIFRDMKPSNIIVDEARKLTIIDWGVCEDYVNTPNFAKIGTEGYSSPEQYEGEGDPRTDIFSLGASLHHLATGVDPRQQKPFAFRFDLAHELNPAISAPFSDVISRAVSKERESRFQSAAEMREALLACR